MTVTTLTGPQRTLLYEISARSRHVADNYKPLHKLLALGFCKKHDRFESYSVTEAGNNWLEEDRK